MDRKFVITALIYALLGLLLGIHMAASQNHGQLVTHAHIMLIGFVVSFIYGLCHKLWLDNDSGRLAVTQFYVHQLGAFFVFLALFLLYGGYVAPEKLEPVLAASSWAVFAGMLLMATLFIRTAKSARA